MSKKFICPSILAADFANLEKEVKAIEKAGADWVHVDVMDGHFVPNLTIGAPVVKSLSQKTDLPLDVHLMIENPENYVDDFIKAGSNYITFHVEAAKDSFALIKDIKSKKVKAGISLKPATPLSDIEPYLSEVDLVLVMTVEPGFGGQKFMSDQVGKINKLKEIRDAKHYDYLIEVDGGVTDITIGQAAQADAFVAGSFIFKADSYHAAVKSLREAL